MANLLPKAAARPPFAVLEADRLARLETRVRELSRSWGGAETVAPLAANRPVFSGLASELAELEESPTPGAAHALLHAIDEIREALRREQPSRGGDASERPVDGEWLCYAPGCSLATGEAEIASQGFFDVLDRPPIGLWLEVLTRPAERGVGAFELAILCWVPAALRDRARAGQRAATSGSLRFVDDLSPALAEQLRALEPRPR